jgi:putative chitinase
MWEARVAEDRLPTLLGERALPWVEAFARARARWRVPDGPSSEHLLAQVLHETGGLKHLTEGMRYSPERLMAVWPSRFPTVERARAAAALGEPGLAELVYGGRLGNGPQGSGDGWRYRGRGAIQLTGKANYQAYASASGVDVVRHPELLSEPEVAADAAAWYWSHRGITPHAERDDLEAVTRAVNGGLNGLADRRAWLLRLRSALPAAASEPVLTLVPPAPVGPAPAPAVESAVRFPDIGTVVLHALSPDDVAAIVRAALRGEPAVLRAPFAVSLTPSPAGLKADLRRTA